VKQRYKNKITQTKQLVRVHIMRVKACKDKYYEAKKLQEKAQRDVDERKEKISKLNNQKKQVYDYLQQAYVAASPHLVQTATVRSFWLNYDLEKDEYYLSMDESDLTNAIEVSNKARLAWLRAQAREDGVQSLLRDTEKEAFREQEINQELENEEISTRSMC